MFHTRIYFLLLSLAATLVATAQPAFYNLYQMPGTAATNFCINAPANCVRSAPGGGYLISASTADTYPATQDVCLLRTDSLGDTLWVRRIGSPIAEQGRMFCPAEENTWIVPFQGWTVYGQQDHLGVMRITDNGDTLWVRSFGVGLGSGEASCVQPTSDGNFILTGMSTVSTGSLTHLVKFDVNGNMIWGRSHRIAGQMSNLMHFYCWRIAETPDHGFVIAGFTTNAVDQDNLIAKVDSAGNLQWVTSCSPSPVSHERINDFCFMPNGDILAISCQNDLVGHLICLSAGGQLLWSKQYDHAKTVSICPLGNDYLITGMYLPPTASYAHPLAMAIDSAGNVLWAKSYDVNSTRQGLFQHATVTGGHIAFTGISNIGWSNSPWTIVLAVADLGGNSCNSVNVPMPVTPLTLSVASPSAIPYTAFPVVQYNYPAGVLQGIGVTNVCSTLTGVAAPAIAPLSVHPVPNAGRFTIALPAGMTHAAVEITDCSGKRILRQTIPGDGVIDISGQPNGVYFLRVYEGDLLFGVSRVVLAQ
jgi:hypothetical protein